MSMCTVVYGLWHRDTISTGKFKLTVPFSYFSCVFALFGFVNENGTCVLVKKVEILLLPLFFIYHLQGFYMISWVSLLFQYSYYNSSELKLGPTLGPNKSEDSLETVIGVLTQIYSKQ